jgi:transcriptional accessory protein Tex/SPT6
MSADPWDTIEDRFPQGKPVEGIVTKTKKYGAFLQIADGVEGLLHISELSWDHVERTEDVLKVGDKVTVMVLNADKVRRRISLSLRQLQGRGAGSGDVGEEYYPGADYEPAQVGDAAPELAALHAGAGTESPTETEAENEREHAEPEAAAPAPPAEAAPAAEEEPTAAAAEEPTAAPEQEPAATAAEPEPAAPSHEDAE